MKLKADMDMLHGSLWNKILLFALPLTITGMLQQLFNATDIAVVGQFVGKEAMAAVGCNAPAINLIVNLFLGVGLGINVVISQAVGRGDKERIHKTVHTAILFALICGTIIGSICIASAPYLMHLMSVPDNIHNLAELYFRIYFLGLPVILLFNFSSAIFASRGDTRTPLVSLMLSGVANIGLNLLFVVVFKMSVEGVAIATVVANLLSVLFLLFILIKRSPNAPTRIELKKLHIYPKELRLVLKIGLPAGLQGMVFAISNICIQSAINGLGSDIMAASAAAFNIEIFAYYLITGFGQSCTTFVGQNYGAGLMDRCRRVLFLTLGLSLLFTALFSAIIMFFAYDLLELFNKDPAVGEFGIIRLEYILIPEVINGCIEVFSGAMRGLGRSLAPAITALVGICGFRILWVATFYQQAPSYERLMACYPLSWLVTMIPLAVVCIRRFRRL